MLGFAMAPQLHAQLTRPRVVMSHCCQAASRAMLSTNPWFSCWISSSELRPWPPWIPRAPPRVGHQDLGQAAGRAPSGPWAQAPWSLRHALLRWKACPSGGGGGVHRHCRHSASTMRPSGSCIILSGCSCVTGRGYGAPSGN